MEIHVKIQGQAVSVEVSDDVSEYLNQAGGSQTENLAHEQRRHWNGREFNEYIISHECSRSYYQTPEELLCRKETLYEIIAALP